MKVENILHGARSLSIFFGAFREESLQAAVSILKRHQNEERCFQKQS